MTWEEMKRQWVREIRPGETIDSFIDRIIDEGVETDVSPDANTVE